MLFEYVAISLQPAPSAIGCIQGAVMRKLIFIGFVALGTLVGFASAAKTDWGTRLVMIGVGALFGAPVGGAIASIGRQARQRLECDENLLPGNGTSSRDLAANYWRDEGHPPFSKPTENEDEIRIWDRNSLG